METPTVCDHCSFRTLDGGVEVCLELLKTAKRIDRKAIVSMTITVDSPPVILASGHLSLSLQTKRLTLAVWSHFPRINGL